MKHRSFIALNIDKVFLSEVESIQQNLKNIIFDGAKWEDISKLHITLKFLGDTEEDVLEKIYLEIQAQNFKIFNLIFDELGVFPDIKSPRIVWIGAKNTEYLNGIYSAIENICIKYGFETEKRKFYPHITLARIKQAQKIINLIDCLKTVNFYPVTINFKNIKIVKSQLSNHGSLYTVLKNISLNE